MRGLPQPCPAARCPSREMSSSPVRFPTGSRTNCCGEDGAYLLSRPEPSADQQANSATAARRQVAAACARGFSFLSMRGGSLFPPELFHIWRIRDRSSRGSGQSPCEQAGGSLLSALTGSGQRTCSKRGSSCWSGRYARLLFGPRRSEGKDVKAADKPSRRSGE